MAAAAALLLALAACTEPGGDDTLPTVPLEATAQVITAAPTQTPTTEVAATPTPPPTLEPTQTPLPTATSAPTATPPPTATPTPRPTATPLPTATPRPPVPGSTRVDLGSGIFLDVSPDTPVAGRDVSFSLGGVPPWAQVGITFVDPQGVPVPWITSEDVNVLQPDGSEATTVQMYPNLSGTLDWKRYAALDETGLWSVDVSLAGNVYSPNYDLGAIDLRDFDTISLGTSLTKRPAQGFTVYYSDLVPTALVADLQDHLTATASLMERRIQADLSVLPDVYLTGNRELMAEVSSVTSVELGFEDGYYANFGERPGIFMRTDLQSTEVRRLLTHEYIHHVFDGLANDHELPAWVTEGLAKYYEFDIAMMGDRPDASLLRLFSSADLARTAARSDSLFSLAALESQEIWNSQTDENQLALQYAQAYMAVRFLNETYGPLSGKEVVEEIGLGFNLDRSIKIVTGLDISVFESQFNRWLTNWEDPERGVVAKYLNDLNVILAAEAANSDQRVVNINTEMTFSEATAARASLVSSTEGLVASLQELSPPARAEAVHQEAQEHLGRVLDWLSLELQAAEQQSNSLLAQANAMIPELTARNFNLNRNISNVEFIFNIAS